ncbi:MAG: hypothetical protein P0Y52_13445 [Candidatus Brevundimonas phytovorans]|nr:hypothetical protein [Brevundimonas sp.]WEK57529.1 MAG: hypothetical protein P0Y52_13445 [Brevundimonas sp.]
MRAAPKAIVILAAVVAPLALVACATGNPLPTYQQEYDALNAQCVARGGILSPSGLTTGRAQTDYVCKITGGATRIP